MKRTKGMKQKFTRKKNPNILRCSFCRNFYMGEIVGKGVRRCPIEKRAVRWDEFQCRDNFDSKPVVYCYHREHWVYLQACAKSHEDKIWKECAKCGVGRDVRGYLKKREKRDASDADSPKEETGNRH